MVWYGSALALHPSHSCETWINVLPLLAIRSNGLLSLLGPSPVAMYKFSNECWQKGACVLEQLDLILVVQRHATIITSSPWVVTSCAMLVGKCGVVCGSRNPVAHGSRLANWVVNRGFNGIESLFDIH